MAVKQEGKVNVWLFVFLPPLLHFPTAHLAGAPKERDAYVKGRGLWVSLTHPQEILRMKEGKKTSEKEMELQLCHYGEGRGMTEMQLPFR